MTPATATTAPRSGEVATAPGGWPGPHDPCRDPAPIQVAADPGPEAEPPLSAPGCETEAEPRAAAAGGLRPTLNPVIAVPVRCVRFLQAMAEDGPGAHHHRIGDEPVQGCVQRTLC